MQAASSSSTSTGCPSSFFSVGTRFSTCSERGWQQPNGASRAQDGCAGCCVLGGGMAPPPRTGALPAPGTNAAGRVQLALICAQAGSRGTSLVSSLLPDMCVPWMPVPLPHHCPSLALAPLHCSGGHCVEPHHTRRLPRPLLHLPARAALPARQPHPAAHHPVAQVQQAPLPRCSGST